MGEGLFSVYFVMNIDIRFVQSMLFASGIGFVFLYEHCQLTVV